MIAQTPLRTLPDGYRETRHLIVTEGNRVLWLNVVALAPLLAAVALMAWWWSLVVRVRGANPGGDLSWWVGVILLVVVILPLHEGLHGLAILLVGHKPRFGAKLDKGVIYATADGALFRRREFLFVALLPLGGITALGMILQLVLLDGLGYWAAMGVAFNAGSAIGDLWMAAVVLQHSTNALVKDEEDGIRVFEPG